MIVVIYANGSIASIPRDTPSDDAEELGRIVGGWIEHIHSYQEYQGEFAQLVVDEEGKVKNLPINHRATELWHTEQRRLYGFVRNGDSIRGTAVILTGKSRMT